MRYRVLALVFFLGFASGCEEKPPEARTTFVVSFDLSESTNEEGVRQMYCQSFRKVLSAVDGGDAIVASWITSRSDTEITFPVNDTFPRFVPPNDNPEVVRRYRAIHDSLLSSKREAHAAAVCDSLGSTSRTEMNTSILSALDVARRIFGAYSNSEDVLVLMSDMVEDSELYDFSRLRLTDEEVTEILTSEREENRIPDLRGVRVYVVGAMGATSERQRSLERFWRAYFAETGATVQDYGAALVRFP